MVDKWLWAIGGGLFTLILSLIATVWWQLQKQIAMRDEYQAQRVQDLRETIDERSQLIREQSDKRLNGIEDEINGMRKRIHDLVDRFSAVETGVKYGLFRKGITDE